MNKITWHAAGLTDRGKTRSHNEDNFSISSDLRVFVVADGMGGTENGALASKLAVEELENHRSTNSPDKSEGDALKEWLCVSIDRANKVVRQAQSDTKKSMGTTIVAAVQSDDGLLHIAHVGDSRAYLVRDGEARVLTTDHSVVMEMVVAGRLTKKQAKESPFRHLISRCLGHDEEVACDYMTLDNQPGDWIIIASDGLPAVIEEEELPGIIKDSQDPVQVCNDLVARTLEGGAPDNVTVVCIHYEGSKSPDEGGAKRNESNSMHAQAESSARNL